MLGYPLRLLLAIVVYLGLYILATNLAWALRAPRPGRFGRAVEFVRLWGGRLYLHDLLRLAYYLLVPYLILYYGWASPLDLGLADLDWIYGVGLTVAIALGSLCLLLLAWWQCVRLLASCSAGQTGELLMMRQVQWLEQPWGWAFVLREAMLLESGWALYRSPLLLLAGPYLGVYLGLAAVFVAGLLNARTRHELGMPGRREEIILTASIAVVTATLYVFVHNLWLCIATHFALRVIVLRFVQFVTDA